MYSIVRTSRPGLVEGRCERRHDAAVEGDDAAAHIAATRRAYMYLM